MRTSPGDWDRAPEPVPQGPGASSKLSCSLSGLSLSLAVWSGGGRGGQQESASTQHWEQMARAARCLIPPVSDWTFISYPLKLTELQVWKFLLKKGW